MIDILQHINAIHREVSRTGEEVSVLLRRSYKASVEDVWEALTEPERMQRWFMPISGELKVGGSYQLEGNAGGEILECEPPSRFKVTFGGPTSLVEIRLTEGPEDETTSLELEHSVPAEFAGGGAGALYVGPGWDGALLGLALYVAGQAEGDPREAALSPEAMKFSEHSVRAWVKAIRASGTATEEEITAAAEAAMAQFAPGASIEPTD